jgi:hypothetical protein
MFSRNLYEIEEVTILLFQAIQNKRKNEASFWGHELFISLETNLLKRILLFCAILYSPTYPIYTYIEVAKSAEDYEHMIYVLCACSNNQSYNLFDAISTLTTTDNENYTTSLSTTTTTTDSIKEEDLIHLFEAAREKKQIDRLNSFINTFGIKPFKSVLPKSHIDLFESSSNLMKKYVIHAITRWITDDLIIGTVKLESNIEYVWNKWKKLEGTKEARMIGINPICLKKWIDRKDVSERLQGDPMIIFIDGSKYFKQFDISKSDFEEKLFEIFKDDIPDEWSDEERFVSHSNLTKNTSFNEYALILQSFFI